MPEAESDVASEATGSEMLGPVEVRAPGGDTLSFFGMFASFDTPFEVTTSELAIKFLFPADRMTAEALHARERNRSQPLRPREQGGAK